MGCEDRSSNSSAASGSLRHSLFIGVVSQWEPDCVRFEGHVHSWDAEPGNEIPLPIRENNRKVRCVTFSSDGTCIAPGLDGGTIRIWNTKTAKQIVDPLREHTL